MFESLRIVAEQRIQGANRQLAHLVHALRGRPYPVEEVSGGEVVKTVRAYPWYLATGEEVLADLNNGREPNYVRVVLGIKSDESKASSNMMTPIGGKVHRLSDGTTEESFYETGVREVTEETTLRVVPFKHNTIGEYHYQGSNSYRYRIDNYPQARETHIVGFPILPPQIATVHFLQESEDKLAAVESLTISQLLEVMRTGKFGKRQLIESATYVSSRQGVQISEEEQRMRDQELGDLTNFFDHLENGVIAEKIRLRVALHFRGLIERNDVIEKHLPIREILKRLKEVEKESEVKENQPIPISEFYKETINFFGKRFADQLIVRSVDELRAEIFAEYFRKVELSGVVAVEAMSPVLSTKVKRPIKAIGGEWRDLTDDEKRKIEEQKLLRRLGIRVQAVRKRLSSGNLGVDILSLLPLVTQTEGLTARTTHLALDFEGLLFDLFNLASLRVVRKPDGISATQATDLMLVPINDPKAFVESLAFIQRLHDESFRILAKIFGIYQPQLRTVWKETADFMTRFNNEIRAEASVGKNDLYRIQQVEERNEVRGALLPQLIAYSVHHPDPKVRFEAARKLLIFFKQLEVIPEKDKILAKENLFFNEVFRHLYGGVIGKKWYEDGSFIELRGGVDIGVIVDLKPTKTDESATRKSFEAPPGGINDYYSYNLALVAEDLSLEKRIARVNTMVDELFAFMRSTGYTVRTMPDTDKDTFDFVSRFEKGLVTQEELRARSGKRTGSMGDFIIRRKMVMEAISPKGEVYRCELALYPCDTTPPHLKPWFLGFKEKREDDNYYPVRRVLQRLKMALGMDSILELFYPFRYYPPMVKVRQQRDISEKRRLSP